MLGKLVNKFKKQTIHDGINLSPPKHISSSPAIFDTTTPEQQQLRRRSARLNPDLAIDEKTSPKLQQHSKKLVFPAERVSFVDECCGGSSDDDDDDELEQLEKNSVSNASIGIGSVSSQQNLCGQSPPVLTSSPPLISEIDTNRQVSSFFLSFLLFFAFEHTLSMLHPLFSFPSFLQEFFFHLAHFQMAIV
jgi:hypothetical protein